MKPLAELLGEGPGMVAVREQVGRLLGRQSDSRRLPPILIQGETGTGKGLLAQAIHRAGPRRQGPFVDVNCAAIPETLLEAELFGFERGAFTDARQAKPGLFQTANRGTLFLDEVGLLPEGLQAKLLKAIEERAVRRLGSTRSEPADAWVLTASNEDLVTAVWERRFREDLYHRLAVVTLRLPPLRERGEDVLLLGEHFLTRACADYSLPPKTFAPDARAALLAYRWPGNVREVANVMERVALLSEASLVTAEMLTLPTAAVPAMPASVDAAVKTRRLEDAVGSVEREHLLQALGETRWNITHAAARLGISRDTLRYRIEKYGLRREGSPAPVRRRVAPPATLAPAIPTPATDVPASSAVRWERRRVAFLRASLVLPPVADPRLYPSRTHEVLVEKVQSFGGRVEELSPTGIVGAFGVEPVEDAPRRAAHAAVAIRKAAERAWRGEAERVAVTSAIHVSQCLVGQASGAVQIDLDGKRQAWTVLEALVSDAAPDSVTISEAAAPFLDRHFELTPLTRTEAATGGRAYRLEPGERPGLTLGRRMATFAGRGHELDLLRSRLASAMRGHGQVVAILGEAGIGKSRLLFEFLESVREDVRLTHLQGRCQSYGSAIPYLPVLDILRQNFRISELDSPESITDKVRIGLQWLEIDPDEWAPYVLQLLGVKEGTEQLAVLTPAAIKARTFETLRQMGLLGSRRRPIVFVVEDLQWIDRTSEECFAALMESLTGAPALFLTTYRPGYRALWMDRSYVTQVALQPLSPDDSLSVVRSVLKMDDVPDRLAQVILDKTEGNPFFLEELSRAVGETGELRLPAAVPDTIQEVLLARVDRLPDEARRLLQSASVLGREIPLPLLRAVWEGPGDLEPHLAELTRLEFLYPQSGGMEPVYAFTHTLTQEVAYESLPIARRQTIHAAIGQVLERGYADRLEEAYDRLAYHYARAEQANKAVEYLTRSGEKAARGHAHTEGVRILEEALRHVERLPAADQDRAFLDLILRQAYSLIPLGRFQEVVDLFLQYRARLDRLDDPRVAGPYHLLIGRSYLFLGDEARASEHATMAIREATRCGDDATLGKIHYVLAQQFAMSGRPREGLEHGRQAVALLARAGEAWWTGPAYWAVGLNHALLGEFGPALEAEAQATQMGTAAGDPQVQSSAAWATGVIHTTVGDWDAGIAACRRAIELSPDPLNSALALGWLGYAYLEKGDAAEARPPLTQALGLLGQFHFPQPQGWFTAYLADAYRLGRQHGTARELAGQAATLTRDARSVYGSGLARRVQGRIALDLGDLSEAEARLNEALDLFGSVPARHDVARTHLDLAALSRAQGRPEAVARHLDEAHAAFCALGVPRQVERAAQLALAFGVRLSAAAS
ncbi:MAG: sigma 54-interacting transcriptional regulator [Candidatus Rokuibacteriota bacterium]